MRSRKIFLIAAFICTWTFLTYFLLLRSQSDFGPRKKEELYRKLDYLEGSVKDEINKQNKLVENLVKILKSQPERVSVENNDKLVGVKDSKYGVEGNGDIIYSENHFKEVPPDGESKRNHLLPPYNAKEGPKPVIPVLVFACNRVSISKCLNNLIQYRPSKEQFPIIVSQDCGDEATKKTILSYKEEVTLIEQPDLSDITVPAKEKKFKGYYKIARHYGWALNTTFKAGYDYLIIVEDDLNVSPDFFEYFLGTYQLLQNDSSLWCVSAWNDNGKANLIDNASPEILYRTDFFPGLGWMLTKELWKELSPKWPKSFWDDWIRHPQQRKERACIRPEISRTRTFGKIGVSNGLFYDKYLKHIKLSEEFIPFTKLNLTYLLKDNYDKTFIRDVYDCPVVTYEELRRNLVTTKGPVRIQYKTKDQYKKTAKMLGLMDDFKSGVPRTGYHGIVSFFYNNQRVYFAPNINWKGYDLSWS